MHQQAHEGADAALVPFDVEVFPVQRTQRRRATAAGRVAHVGVRASGEGDFMGGEAGDEGGDISW